MFFFWRRDPFASDGDAGPTLVGILPDILRLLQGLQAIAAMLNRAATEGCEA
jgi:hypothetical protein